MGYVVYTGKNCHDCDLVVHAMRKKKIDFRVVHVEKSKEEPPVDVYVRPALFQDDRLIAYGRDILGHFDIPEDHPRPMWVTMKLMWGMMLKRR